MILRPLFGSVVLFGLGLMAACGGGGADELCDRTEDCAKKASVSFSVTQCKDRAVQAREEADTQGCSDEYADYESCVGGLDFECEDLLGDGLAKKAAADCGAKAEKYNKCK